MNRWLTRLAHASLAAVVLAAVCATWPHTDPASEGVRVMQTLPGALRGAAVNSFSTWTLARVRGLADLTKSDHVTRGGALIMRWVLTTPALAAIAIVAGLVGYAATRWPLPVAPRLSDPIRFSVLKRNHGPGSGPRSTRRVRLGRRLAYDPSAEPTFSHLVARLVTPPTWIFGTVIALPAISRIPSTYTELWLLALATGLAAGGLLGSTQRTQRRAGLALGLGDRTVVRISDLDARTNLAILGAPGTGKTRLAFSICAQRIREGLGVAILDPKATAKNLAEVIGLCAAYDRLEDLYVIHPSFPELSHRWNPAQGGSVESRVERFAKLFPVGERSSEDARFFRTMVVDATRAAFRALDALGQPYSIEDVVAFVQHAPIRDWVRARLAPQAALELASFEATFASPKGGRSGEFYLKLTSELVARLRAFTGSGRRELFCTPTSDFDLVEDIVKPGRILFVGLPSGTQRSFGEDLARLVIADLLRAVEHLGQTGQRVLPFTVFIDEIGRVLTDGLDDALEGSREAGVGWILAGQSLGSLQTIGENTADRLLGASSTHAFFRVADPKTQDLASLLCGKVLEWRPDVRSQAKSRSWSLASTVRSGTNQQRTMKLDHYTLIEPHEFGLVPDGTCVLRKRDGSVSRIQTLSPDVIARQMPPIEDGRIEIDPNLLAPRRVALSDRSPLNLAPLVRELVVDAPKT